MPLSHIRRDAKKIRERERDGGGRERERERESKYYICSQVHVRATPSFRSFILKSSILLALL